MRVRLATPTPRPLSPPLVIPTRGQAPALRAAHPTGSTCALPSAARAIYSNAAGERQRPCGGGGGARGSSRPGLRVPFPPFSSSFLPPPRSRAATARTHAACGARRASPHAAARFARRRRRQGPRRGIARLPKSPQRVTAVFPRRRGSHSPRRRLRCRTLPCGHPQPPAPPPPPCTVPPPARGAPPQGEERWQWPDTSPRARGTHTAINTKVSARRRQDGGARGAASSALRGGGAAGRRAAAPRRRGGAAGGVMAGRSDRERCGKNRKRRKNLLDLPEAFAATPSPALPREP